MPRNLPRLEAPGGRLTTAHFDSFEFFPRFSPPSDYAERLFRLNSRAFLLHNLNRNNDYPPC